MPDATTIAKGEIWRARNAGATHAWALQDNAGGVLVTAVAAAEVVEVQCEANGTAAGTWRVLQTAAGAKVATAADPPSVRSVIGAAYNWLINGSMEVAQRCDLTTSANPLGDLLGTTPRIGKVDGWAGYMSSGTAITAGTLTQNASAPIGTLGFSAHASGITMTGSARFAFVARIRSTRARRLKNKTVSIGVLAYHDVASTIGVQITVNKPTAADNYTAKTQIAQSSSQNVATTTGTQVTLLNVNLGDCSNGVEVIVEFNSGAVTTRNFHIAEAMLVEGSTLPAVFPFEDWDALLARCRTQFNKTFLYSIPPAQNALNGSGTIWATSSVNRLGANWPVGPMEVAPTCMSFNNNAANALWWDNDAGGSSGGVGLASSETNVMVSGSGTATDGKLFAIHVIAKAELF